MFYAYTCVKKFWRDILIGNKIFTTKVLFCIFSFVFMTSFPFYLNLHIIFFLLNVYILLPRNNKIITKTLPSKWNQMKNTIKTQKPLLLSHEGVLSYCPISQLCLGFIYFCQVKMDLNLIPCRKLFWKFKTPRSNWRCSRGQRLGGKQAETRQVQNRREYTAVDSGLPSQAY